MGGPVSKHDVKHILLLYELPCSQDINKVSKVMYVRLYSKERYKKGYNMDRVKDCC